MALNFLGLLRYFHGGIIFILLRPRIQFLVSFPILLLFALTLGNLSVFPVVSRFWMWFLDYAKYGLPNVVSLESERPWSVVIL